MKSRKVILDTETTGLNPTRDRVFEIACLEMLDYDLTGNEFHYYLNPEQVITDEAAAVSGMKNEFLIDKPLFQSIVHEFLDFIGNDPIIAHNASFDINMLNAELKRCGLNNLSNPIIDTLLLARKIFPGGNNTLDNLCKKYRIKHNNNVFHDALGDTRRLSTVYYYLNIAQGSLNNIQNLELDSTEKPVNIIIKNRLNPDCIDEQTYKQHMDFCTKNKLTVTLNQ